MSKHLLSLTFVLLSTLAWSQTYTWTNGGADNLWSTGANWDLGTAPVAGDTAVIGTGQTVTLDLATTVHRLTVTSATLHLNGFQLQVDSSLTLSNSIIDDGTFAAGTLYGDSVGFYNITNTTSNAEFLIYSADWGNCNGNTYNGEVFYSHIGSTNENILGNNTYNNKVSFQTLNGRFRPESNSNTTFNADTVHLYNYGISEHMYLSQAARATFNSVILSVNCTSTGTIRIGSNGGNTGAIKLNGTSNFHVGNFIDGNFYIYHTEQQNANAINMTFVDSVNCYFLYDSIKGPLTVEARNVVTRENSFFNTVNIKKIGNGSASSAGGNHFMGLTTIENAGSGEIRYGTNGSLPDTFDTDVTLINSGTGRIQMARNASNTTFGGDIYLNSTNGSGIRFGQGGGTMTLGVGKRFIIGGLGFSAGSLRLRGVNQADATAQNIVLTGTAQLRLEQNCTWDGTMTFDAPRVYLNGGTFNATVNVNKTSGGNDHSNGSCTFNGDLIITHSSTGRLRFASNAGNVNTYNGNVTFVLTGGGSIQPAYAGNSVFNGNVIVNPNKTITFSAGGGSSTFSGGAAQNIQDLSGSFPPAFDSLQINKTGNDLTLNTEISINDGATFTAGNIISSAANLMVFNNGSEAYNASNSSHVQGPVRKFGTQTFTFPVGKAGNRYAPISISAPTAANDHFTAEYFDIPNYGLYDTISMDGTLDHVSRCEYWILDQGGASSNTVNVTLSWDDPRSCGVDKISDLRVCRWDGATWKDHGSTATTGTNANGTITSTGISSFSPFTLGSVSTDNPLPIELAGFEAVQNDKVVDLNWATHSEINNAFFTIERSADGMNWEEILYMEGAGNSTNYISYFDVDPNPLMGKNFYRLKQTDFDGRYEYSHVVFVNFKETEERVEIFPNPNEGIYFNINLQQFQNKEVLLVVRDLMGKELYSKVVFSSEKGQPFTFNFENQLPKGTYLVIASSEDELVSKKLIIE